MLTTPNIILVLSTLGAFLAVLGVVMPFLQSDGRSNRLKYLARRREELQQQQQQKFEEQRQASLRRRETRSQNLMQRVLNRLNLMDRARSPELRNKLMQAGWRGQGPAIAYIFAQLALPMVFASVIALVLFSAKKFDFDPLLKLLICAGAAGIGYFVPDIMVSNTAKKRQTIIIRSFPDALDLIVICVEAGISLEQAFTRVSQEMADMAPMLSEEFALTTAELAYLGDRRQALENLATRTGAEPVKALATTLIQSEKYGTPLGVALRVLSRENREERMARAEQKAGSLPAALTVPMILFFLPVLFIVLIGPSIIQVIQTFQE